MWSGGACESGGAVLETLLFGGASFSLFLDLEPLVELEVPFVDVPSLAPVVCWESRRRFAVSAENSDEY